MEREISNSTMVSMIEEKLPKSIKGQWCLEVCDEDDEIRFPKFLKFLLKQKRAIEYGSSDIRAGTQNKVQQGSTHLGQGSWSRPKIERENCWIHDGLEGGAGDHPIWKCRKFKGMAVSERLVLAETYKACRACLLKRCPGATSPDRCASQFKCREPGCNQRHNQLLHAIPTKASTAGVTHHTDQDDGVKGAALLPVQDA